MKMRNIFRLSIFLILICCIIPINLSSAVEIKDKFVYLLDTRGDDGDICLNRLSINKKLASCNVELSAFGETQWNFDVSDWEKLLLGIEGSTTIWRYLNIGQSLQFISGEILDHMSFDAGVRSYNATTKIGVKIPFMDKFLFHAFEEYSVNLEELRDELNEVGIEIIYKPKKWISFGSGWHHTDRIHNFDTDYISSSLTLHF
ncbi:hypothetical protein ACFL60_07455 [Candidatus Omnitrophota bacterium]